MIGNYATSRADSTLKKKLIKDLLPVLGNDETMGKIVKAFYEILLEEKYPRFKKMFNDSNRSSGRQINALSAALLEFFSKIENTEKQIIDRFKLVIIKHVSLGVKKDNYQAVGECLVDAIQKVIPGISEEQIAAIGEAYCYLSNILIKKEAEIYKTIENEKFGGWKGEREFIVTKIEEENEDGKIKSFYLKPNDGKKIPGFEAGDYITVSANNQLRQYSLSNYGEGADLQYRITVKREDEGCVSTYLHELEEGKIVKMRPPVGIFHLKEEHIGGKLPIILLSSGNGLTPVLSMLHKLSQEKYEGKVYYIHCTQSQKTHAMEKEVEDTADENIKIFNFYSQEREEKASDKAKYIMQRINQKSLQEILKDEKIDDCRFYCCGSERWFIGQEKGNSKEFGVKDLLINMGVKEDQIFTENFGPSFAIPTVVSRKGSPSLNVEKGSTTSRYLAQSDDTKKLCGEAEKKCQEKQANVKEQQISLEPQSYLSNTFIQGHLTQDKVKLIS